MNENLDLPRVYARLARICAKAHAGKLDAAGAPYSGHLDRVRGRAEALRARLCPDLDPYAVACVAVAHDLVEDTDVTLEDISFAGEDICQAVGLLTHKNNEPRDEYIGRVCKNRLAALVKLADTLDNSDPVRLSMVTDPARKARLERKYAAAEPQLRVALSSKPAQVRKPATTVRGW